MRLRVTDTGEPLLRVDEVRRGWRDAEELAASEKAARREEALARRRAEELAASEVAARREAEERVKALEAELGRRADPR